MIRLITLCLAFKANRQAVTALEYGLIAGLIVATIAVGFAGLANALSSQFTVIGDSL
jgi:Flp pilus assembly pilin Flp